MDKTRAVIDNSSIESITVAIINVPCCGGLMRLVDDAAASTSRFFPVSTVVVGIEGGSLT